MRKSIQIGIVALFLLCGLQVRAQEVPYLCELGLQGGIGYYVGDAAPHIFMHPREAYGIQFRYKFTKRWAIQAKFSGQRITGSDFTKAGDPLSTMWENRLYNVDVMAEFNFFRFDSRNENDRRIKPYTPYIFIGIGAGLYNGIPAADASPTDPTPMTAMAYVPLGIGFKWKFAERVGLNVAWQHNIYMADNLEARKELDNTYQLNGWNWMNCDLTGMFTVALVVEFAKAPKPCRICNW